MLCCVVGVELMLSYVTFRLVEPAADFFLSFCLLANGMKQQQQHGVVLMLIVSLSLTLSPSLSLSPARSY